MIDKNPTNNKYNQGEHYELTDRDRYGKRAQNKTIGDIVTPERLDNPLNLASSVVDGYLQFTSITTPETAPTNTERLYHKSTGTDSKLFVKQDNGVEVELASTAAFSPSLEDAYQNGSEVDVNTTNVTWRLSSSKEFEITNNSGATNYLNVKDTGVTVFGYQLPLFDGSAGDVLTTNGVGVTTFESIGSIGDSIYLRLDGTNSPITGDVLVGSDHQLQFRDTDIFINSSVDGQLDIESDVTISLNTADVVVADGDLIVESGRIQGNKGNDVASGGTITLTSGNYFDITGNTAIDYITTTDWQAGSVVALQFDSNPTVNNNTAAPPAGTASILLAASANFATTAGDTLQLVYDGVTWRELSRTVI